MTTSVATQSFLGELGFVVLVAWPEAEEQKSSRRQCGGRLFRRRAALYHAPHYCRRASSQAEARYRYHTYPMDPVFEVAREEGTRAGTFFYHVQDGLHYHLSDTRQGSTYYKCVLAAKGCRGRATFDAVDGFVHTARHNHEPDLVYPDEMALRRNILRRCERLEYTPFRRIIFEEGRRFGPEVVARVTYARMRTSMRNARLSRFPNPLPANLVELTDILQDPRYTVITMSDDGLDNIYGGSVTDIDGFHHILFISERMLQRARTFRILHSDGTFRVTPHGPEFAVQVFCIVAVWNHHIITVGWVLMTSLTENAYTAVLQLLQQRLGPGIELTKVISDFETGQQNAWQNVFNVRTQGCVWHLSRAFLQEVAELNLVNRMRNIEEVRRIIRLTLGLALLPEPFIVDGYHVILNHAVGEGNYIYRMVLPYLRYVWRYWVSRPWRRARMCVHGSSQRTNNACESQNKVLREECGIHSNVYMFLAGLVRLEQKNYNILLSLDQFRRVSRARKTTSIMNDNRIQMATEELFDPPGPIAATIFRFLSVVSHTMDNMVEELMLDRLRRRRRQ